VAESAVFGPIRWTDLLIPAVMLSMRQWEALVGVPNPAHSSLPLVLLMCYALAWTCRHRIVRYALALLFNFLAVFTGFGFFLGLITPILLIIDCLHIIRREGWRPAAPTICVFVLSLVTLGAFFHGYVFDPAAPNFQFPHPGSTCTRR
jgi:hypothetical protein